MKGEHLAFTLGTSYSASASASRQTDIGSRSRPLLSCRSQGFINAAGIEEDGFPGASLVEEENHHPGEGICTIGMGNQMAHIQGMRGGYIRWASEPRASP